MSNRPATRAEIRRSYKKDGYEVRITHDGAVLYRLDLDYRPAGWWEDRSWKEGRHIEDYWMVDGEVELS